MTEDELGTLARLLDLYVPADTEYTILLRDTRSGALVYMSNAERARMIRTMHAFLEDRTENEPKRSR